MADHFNRHPFEKLCLKKLQQAGMVPAEDKPYSLQLLLWTLGSHSGVIPADAREHTRKLYETATQMFEWDGKTVQNYLRTADAWPKEQMKELEQMNPELVGGQLASNLYVTLRENGML